MFAPSKNAQLLRKTVCCLSLYLSINTKIGFSGIFGININTDTNISRGLKLKLSRERYYIYGMIVCLFL